MKKNEVTQRKLLINALPNRVFYFMISSLISIRSYQMIFDTLKDELCHYYLQHNYLSIFTELFHFAFQAIKPLEEL